MRYFLAGTLLVVALAVAGCGGGSSSGGGNGEASKSAEQVLTDTAKAADAARSLRMSGKVSASGQQISIDLTIVKGKGATGSITLKGLKVDLRIIRTEAYMKAGAAFWKQFGGRNGSTIAQLVAGKWLKFPTTNPQFGALTALADSKSLFDSLSSNHGTLTNKGATTYKGKSVVAIFDNTKNATLDVAATGTPYPVALVKTGSGTIAFDNWNKSVTLTAPAGAVDISNLRAG